MPEQNPDRKPGAGRPPAGPKAMKGGSRFRMRNWRLRTKVIAVIVVPTLTALALGGLRAADDLSRAGEFQQTVSQVDLARNVTKVVHELQKERTLMVAWVAGEEGGPRTELDTQIDLVNGAVAASQQTASDLDIDDETAKNRYNIGLQRLSALPAIRTTVEESNYPAAAAFVTYTQVLDAVVRLGREINSAVTDRDLLRDGTVVQAVSEAKESISQENAILQIAAADNRFTGDMLQRLRDAQASYIGSLADFRANASLDQLQLYNDTVSGAEVDLRERIKAVAITAAEEGTGRENPPPLNIDGPDLTNNGNATIERMRTVETELLDQLRSDATVLADAATTSAWQEAAIVLVALLLAIGLMAIVTRSLLNPLRVLRREALEVANRRLPASVQRILADPDPAEAAKHAVEPVPVFTKEETGQLARSFDAVQEQAVLMATEQALLRDNINSIFVNLSRRSQALVERQLSLIDRLEQDEQDPDQLASLFELDHLATRMRRNSESLLVLSGTGLSRQLNRPVPASEVVGAAVSEVEHYARVEVASAPDVAVQGRAVSDLVHVIAELLDNATFFSEPEKKVIVRMAMTRKRELAVQITDQGVGMSEDEIAAANARLADPPDLDVAVTRRMGLYVVARLAKRHNIVVRLRDNEDIEGGLIARINVPADLVQPVGAAPRSMSATSTTSSLQAAAMDSANGLGASMPNVPNTPAPVRNSGIAGAFTGGMPRLRPDGSTGDPASSLGAETSQDRTPEQVAGYPAYSPGYGADQNGSVPANGTDPHGHQADQGDDRGDADEQTTTLFGNPMPDPGPPRQDEADYPPLGAGRAADEVDHNVDAPTERLPIYEAVLSQWFEAADTGSHQRQPAEGEQAGHAATNGAANGNGTNGTHATHAANGTGANGTHGSTPPAEPQHAAQPAPQPQAEAETTAWTSPGDEGWQAAQALLDKPAEETKTTAGLPKRVPKAHLVPGSAQPRQTAQPTEEQSAPPLPPRTADAVRGRMSSFQQGVRRGRHALIEAYAGDQSGPEVSRQDEEQE
ncbi:sensor histidine kinase [Actinophytocola gossypii]|uniref:histidine kinase n=1 Tax=Actinophytocola gossypii TaxID=2812003 RepID=A0ABT2J522_9PSEU|nr:nitrate- and nitrite sensing domain-containing protein [Actinophytocola gossypii]MCT2582694.1 sensor histidine kinase [Actinophytocola gossypii]